MPTYPLAFPDIHPGGVVAKRRRVQAAAESPFTLQQQIFDWGAGRWEITVTMQRMDKVDATTFGQFLDDLNGMVGTFTFNLDPWVPKNSALPGTKTFRLASPNTVWDSDRATMWEFQFEAVEVV